MDHLPDHLFQNILFLCLQDSLDEIGVFLPFRNSLQNFPRPPVAGIFQFGPEGKNGPLQRFDICPTIRSNPAALAWTSVR